MDDTEWNRYFIGIVVPAPWRDEIDILKNYLAVHYKSSASLRSPPHLTLHMPFRWKLARESVLIDKLSSFFRNRNPLQLQLQDFGCFEPRVIFIRCLPNPVLSLLQEDLKTYSRTSLNLLNSEYKNRPWEPHVTVAFRDLTKTAFGQAWPEFEKRKFQAAFEINRITLLKPNDGVWEEYHSFVLS